METWKLIHDFDKAAILKLPRTNTVKRVISLVRQFGSKAIQCCSCTYLFVFVQFIPIMYSEGHFRKKKKFYIKSSKVSSNIVSLILIRLHIKTLFQHQLSFDEHDPPSLSFHLLWELLTICHIAAAWVQVWSTALCYVSSPSLLTFQSIFTALSVQYRQNCEDLRVELVVVVIWSSRYEVSV